MANQTSSANQYQEGNCEIVDFHTMHSCNTLGTLCKIEAGHSGMSITMHLCDDCISEIIFNHPEWKITKLRKQ